MRVRTHRAYLAAGKTERGAKRAAAQLVATWPADSIERQFAQVPEYRTRKPRKRPRKADFLTPLAETREGQRILKHVALLSQPHA